MVLVVVLVVMAVAVAVAVLAVAVLSILTLRFSVQSVDWYIQWAPCKALRFEGVYCL